MPFFSIITIGMNVREDIEHTLDSVLHQNMDDYEYIVVDGASNDGTQDLIAAYEKKFLSQNRQIKWISEHDTGIYNAMNKGIRMSNGRWLLFLNAGDYLCKNNVLSDVKNILQEDDETDIFYGDMILEKNRLFTYEYAVASDVLTYKMPFSHQSTFISRELICDRLYDESYKYVADYDFFMDMYKQHKTYRCEHLPISVFIWGGASTNGDKRFIYRESLNARLKYGFIKEEEVEDDFNRNVKDMSRLEDKIARVVEKVLPDKIEKKLKSYWNANRFNYYKSIEEAIIHKDEKKK